MSYFQTGNDYHPWWAVDLKSVYNVEKVVLANRDSSKFYSIKKFDNQFSHKMLAHGKNSSELYA